MSCVEASDALRLVPCRVSAYRATALHPQPAPLTEVEALRVQNVNLERVIVQRALDDWQKKVL